MMNRKVVVLVLLLITATVMVDVSAGPVLLTNAEMAAIEGGNAINCGYAVGGMTSFALAAGLLSAPIPPLSLGFLTVAGVLGAGVAVFC